MRAPYSEGMTSAKPGNFFSRLWPLLIIAPLIVAVGFFVQVHAQSFSQTIYNPAAPVWKIEVPLIFVGTYAVWRTNSFLVTLGFAFSVGGFAANCLAHYIFGPVADYIPVPLLPGGAECNIADLCLTTGAALLVISIFLVEPLRRKRLRQAEPVISCPQAPLMRG